MPKRLILIALSIYALSVVAALCAPRTSQPGTPGNAANKPAPSGPASSSSSQNAPPRTPLAPTDLILGFALNLHYTENLDRYIKAVDEMADMGFNAVEVLTPSFQNDGTSENISVEIGDGLSPKREHLVTLLKHARSRGLRTKLMPIVLLTDPRGNEWRGKIQPENWDPWWKSYRKNLDYYIDIANESDVTVFSVGSELLSTERQGDRWTPLISHARQRFKGKYLSYSTNWDHYQVPVFWKQLDIIGINGYWDLTTLAKDSPPEASALVARWQQIRNDVLTFGKSMDMPVLLTEIGYPSLPWGLKDPWNYVAASETAPDAAPQLAGYKAFLETWDDLLVQQPNPNRLRGVFFYKWDVFYHGGSEDTGYGVRGKPTYDLLKTFLKARSK